MTYIIEDTGDHVHLTSKEDKDEYGRPTHLLLLRAEAQELHDSLYAICAGGCPCKQAGFDEGLRLAQVRRDIKQDKEDR